MNLYKKVILKKEIVDQAEGVKGKTDRLMSMGASEVHINELSLLTVKVVFKKSSKLFLYLI